MRISGTTNAVNLRRNNRILGWIGWENFGGFAAFLSYPDYPAILLYLLLS